MKRVVLSLLMLAASSSFASGIEGWGRISVGGGPRWIPNWWFVDNAAMAGTPVINHVPLGGHGNASFGYGVTAFLEVTVDIFAGYEAFALQGLDGQRMEYGSFAGAAMLGGRLVAKDIFGKGFSPWLSVQGGGLLSSLNGPNVEIFERLMPSFAAGGGFDIRFNERYGMSVDARYLYGRSYVPPISGINVGGMWFTVSVVFFFPPDSKRDLAVPGF
ncbi:MAG: hypothetical protein ACO1OB_03120 [Archangium sp.]